MGDTEYRINMDVRFGALEKIDVNDVVARCDEDWFNTTLCEVNDSLVRLGILKGEFHWHKHDEEDEWFFVLDGELLLDVRSDDGDTTVTLAKNEGYVIPRGVVHRTRAPEKVTVLMVEKNGVVPTGD
ncbi:MAG: cupin domain-containing protein [Planctomycetota bacterium]|jgi:mannose-6-phosphate isomerase-like protein (cupin superfamily)